MTRSADRLRAAHRRATPDSSPASMTLGRASRATPRASTMTGASVPPHHTALGGTVVAGAGAAVAGMDVPRPCPPPLDRTATSATQPYPRVSNVPSTTAYARIRPSLASSGDLMLRTTKTRWDDGLFPKKVSKCGAEPRFDHTLTAASLPRYLIATNDGMAHRRIVGWDTAPLTTRATARERRAMVQPSRRDGRRSARRRACGVARARHASSTARGLRDALGRVR
jgi:hypothetical protein